MFQRTKLASLLIISGLMSTGPLYGASGSFTFVTGDVSVRKPTGQLIRVSKGAEVNAGDAIVTGTAGMAQLTMVDQARISLRPNTQFQIERYGDRPDSNEGAVLSLLRGTLRTFTGLIAATNRDKFVMKTRVATVGIRGSGNILYACSVEDKDCDADLAPMMGGATGGITVNHTIEGSHAVSFGDFGGPGLPPQQGGAQTLITGPGQTVLVTSNGNVRYIPTPQFIADSATNPTGAAKAKGVGGTGQGSGGESRTFGPSDGLGQSSQTQGNTISVGNNGLGFTFTDASGNLIGGDPLSLQDIVIAGGTTLTGQALSSDVVRDGNNLRGYTAYAGLQSGLAPSISGGTPGDRQTFSEGGLTIDVGRWENASLGFFGPGTGGSVPGSVHWIHSGSGFPAYLSDVLTGTATYTRVVNTPPTNQSNTGGTLTSATLDVNFNNRTLNAALGVTMPAGGTNSGGSWQLNATNVPFAFNAFFASTSDRLRIVNGAGTSSQNTANIYGSLEGSFVGSGLNGAIAGYNFSDQTSTNPNNYNTVTGVVGFQSPGQNAAAQYRDGLASDPAGALNGGLVHNYATTNRPEEVVADVQGRVTAFAAPFGTFGGHQSYAIGTASVSQFGIDLDTGLVWGRWSGGVAIVNAGGSPQPLDLNGRSLHYIFSGQQNGPVSLPLTGSATYDVIGSTSPTDNSGHTGTLGSASLAANFTARTVDTNVNVSIAGQSITGSATGVPIYREQYFSAFRGASIPGLPTPQLLNINCAPTCSNPTGSIDGFFAGRNAQGAGMIYNLNNVSGTVAFRRAGT